MSNTDYFEYGDNNVDLNDAEYVRAWVKANWSPPKIADPKIHIHLKFNWTPFIEAWTQAFRKLAVEINRMFPNGVAVAMERRAAAKRVHTAYRQKRGKRW